MIVEGIDIQRIAHACVRLQAEGLVVYVDPFQVPAPEPADVILVTHDHPSHLSLPDIQKLLAPGTTVIIGPVSHPPLLQLDPLDHLVVLGPQEAYEGEGFTVETVAAATPATDQASGRPRHPRDDEGMGFVVTLGGKRIYHAGDTDVLPEMQRLGKIDVALLPVSGKTVMGAVEAIQAAETIKPGVAIPIHWGAGEGTREDAEAFVRGFAPSVLV
ncbi:MAG: MBL fold metallo-hydrolase [Candidatus Aenigmarchaeota archaeon]|nr:MBL fold metallo-hydrolase [Candidatus Aenigmarchaeota archaeon]